MKRMFVAVVLCMALLSSFTVSVSAEFTSTDSDYLQGIWRQITGTANFDTIYDWIKAINSNVSYMKSSFSSTTQSVNPTAYYAQQIFNKMGNSSSKDYSTVLSNIKTNSDSLVSYIKLIEGDTNNISARSTDLLNKLQEVYLRQGQMQTAITNHIDSASAQNHSDFTNLLEVFATSESSSDSQSGDSRYRLYTANGSAWYYSWDVVITHLMIALTQDTPNALGNRSLYGLIHQLQQVLASDDDLQLKKDNKANEDAATDAFVNGSSSKTSLGTGDIGNLKDVGGTFNDLTSLNGQSSVTSFLNGLSSADGTGQGWFSEATRASLDAVSTPVTTTKLVQKTWRGEKSFTYSISADTSVNVVASPAPARAPAVDPDPYNMSGFADNYNWLWGDAS